MDSMKIAKPLGAAYNVTMQVINEDGSVAQEHKSHNMATHGLLYGISRYLVGDGVLNQAYSVLSEYIPKYISIGTMGLINQNEDAEGLPDGVGDEDGTEEYRFDLYMRRSPGFGADGYDLTKNNGRTDVYPLLAGLGPPFARRGEVGAAVIGERPSPPPVEGGVCPVCGTKCECSCPCCNPVDPEPIGTNIYDTVKCELISDNFPRMQIAYREIVDSNKSELPQTIDIVYSAMISVGALKAFRPPGQDYVFITESGLWAKKHWTDGHNGLLAGYRIKPTNRAFYPMLQTYQVWDVASQQFVNVEVDQNTPENRNLLKRSILRVGKNQSVLVTWKLTIGAIDDLNVHEVILYQDNRLTWLELP